MKALSRLCMQGVQPKPGCREKRIEMVGASPYQFVLYRIGFEV